MNNSKYIIIPKHKLIIEYYEGNAYGNVYVDDIIKFKEKLSTDKHHNNHYSLLMDFRYCNVILNKDDIMKIVNFIKNHDKLYGEKTISYLTNSPNNVVMATLFDSYKNDLPLYNMVFTTVQNALHHIGLNKQYYAEIEQHLDNLRNVVI